MLAIVVAMVLLSLVAIVAAFLCIVAIFDDYISLTKRIVLGITMAPMCSTACGLLAYWKVYFF